MAPPAPVLPGGQAEAAAPASQASQFPSMESLRALAEQPLPPASPEASVGAPTLSWTFRGPLPDRAGDVPAHLEAPATRLLIEALAGGGLTMVTANMECVAREVAHHLAEHDQLGPAPLHRAMGAACGVSQLDFGFYSTRRALQPGETEATAFDNLREDIRRLVSKPMGSGPRQAGLWVGVIGQRVVGVVAYTGRRAELAPVVRVPKQGVIEIRGQVMEQAERIVAMSTRGAYGHAFCEPVAGVEPPAFAVTCPVDAADEKAWISIGAFPAGRFLGQNVALLQVWPAGQPVKAYAPEAVAADPPGTLRDHLLRGINELREKANLTPLRLAPEQSDLADRLLPHYFAALGGQTSETDADRITMGLMAGWLVPAMVGDAHTATGSTQQRESQALLRALLEMPHARAALFAPEASYLAVGAHADDRGQSAFITTYEAVSPEDARAAAEAELEIFFQTLTEARKAAGLPPPQRLAPLTTPDFDLMGRRLEGDELDPHLNTLMTLASDRLKAPIQGWVVQTFDVAKVELPAELVQMPQLSVGMVLGYVVQPPDPWTRRAIFVVFPTEAPGPFRAGGEPGRLDTLRHPPKPLDTIHPSTKTSTHAGGHRRSDGPPPHSEKPMPKLNPNTDIQSMIDFAVNTGAVLHARPETRHLAPAWREQKQALRGARERRDGDRDTWIEAVAEYRVARTDWNLTLLELSGLIFLAAGKRASQEPYLSTLGSVTAARARVLGAQKAIDFGSLLLGRLGVLARPDFAEKTAAFQAAQAALETTTAGRRRAYEALRLHNLHRVRLVEELQRAIDATEVEILKVFPGQKDRVRDALSVSRNEERREEVS